jgi:UDP-N-acetylglucosamine 2-epimerase (non-hydrolysing)
MIEERNRKLTDAMSSLLFTHCKEADKNLLDEGIHKSKIYRVGNIMIDSLKVSMRLAQKRESILDRLDIQKREYAVLTLHRPTNVDSIQELKKILQILMSVSPKLPIVFPVHPRTAKSLTMLLKTSEISYRTLSAKIYDKPIVSINDTSKATCPWHGLLLAPPLRYLDFLNLMMNSKLVLTDSGGIQEETTYLKIPCLTLRENTERPVTVSKGTNILVGKDKDKIASNVNKIMEGKEKKGEIPKLWDGKASRRIVRVLYNWL